MLHIARVGLSRFISGADRQRFTAGLHPIHLAVGAGQLALKLIDDFLFGRISPSSSSREHKRPNGSRTGFWTPRLWRPHGFPV